jgi:hypothetical protein
MVWRAHGHASNTYLVVAGVEQIGKLCIYYVPCAGIAFGGRRTRLRPAATKTSAIIIAAIWLEPHYGCQSAIAPAGAAVPTGERFIDDETGQVVEVWYNADTGERSDRAGE